MLLRNTEVLDVIEDRGRVVGVSYRDEHGATRQLQALLTVACDGRSSILRSATGLVPRGFGAPMDVWWFRLPRRPGDPPGLGGVFSAGRATVVIDRGDYSQIAYIIPKGSDAALRAQGIEALHRNLVDQVPWLADRVAALTSFDDVKLLDVQDAMSPVAGVGINLAVADAVAAARLLAGPLRTGRVSTRRLARVQARRWIPTAILQALQRMIHDNVVAAAVDGVDRPAPRPVRLVSRLPALRRLAASTVAIGPMSEHAPAFARR